MAKIIKNWNGFIQGTNTGKIHLKIESQNNDKISGTLRVMDDNPAIGISVYKIQGLLNDGLELTGEPDLTTLTARARVIHYAQISLGNPTIGNISIKATLTPDGNYQAEWESSIGTAGTAILYPANIDSQTEIAEKKLSIQPKLHSNTINLGVLRLSTSDIEKLISEIQQSFTQANLMTVSYESTGRELTRYAGNFLSDISQVKLNSSTIFKIFLKEPESKETSKLISLQFREFSNTIILESADENWVISQSQKLEEFLKPHEIFLATKYKKIGPTINGLILILALIIAPNIENLVYRVFIFIPILIFIWLSSHLNQKFIPMFAIKKTTWIRKYLPSISAWIFNILSAILVAVVLKHFGVSGK